MKGGGYFLLENLYILIKRLHIESELNIYLGTGRKVLGGGLR